MTDQGQGRKAPPQVRGRLRLEWRGRAAHEDGTSLRLQDAEAVVQHGEMNVEATGLEVPRDAPRTFEAITGPNRNGEVRDARRKFLVGHPLVEEITFSIGDGPVILLGAGKGQDEWFAGQVRDCVLDRDGCSHAVDEFVRRKADAQVSGACLADRELRLRTGRFGCCAGQHEL